MIQSLSHFEDLILKLNFCTSVPIKIFVFKGGDESSPQGLFQSLKFVSKKLRISAWTSLHVAYWWQSAFLFYSYGVQTSAIVICSYVLGFNVSYQII